MSVQGLGTGRIVHYRLSESDVKDIRDERPIGGRTGNPVDVGDIVPLVIVRIFPDEFGEGVHGVNGQALLDGKDQLWVTSAREGTEPGQWSWPPRV